MTLLIVSIWLTLVLYAAAMAALIGGWRDVARWLWGAGCVCYLVHAAAAFHFVHEWSHAQAFRHVEQGSDFGAGIYVTYAFTALWPLDVLWWWLAPGSYVRRPLWISIAMHLFTAFMLFNGSVVFAEGASRWLGVGVFGFLAAAWLAAKNRPRHS